jgi:hypothetical protein
MVYEYHLLHHSTSVERVTKSVCHTCVQRAKPTTASALVKTLAQEEEWGVLFWERLPPATLQVLTRWHSHTMSREESSDPVDLERVIWLKWVEYLSIEPSLVVAGSQAGGGVRMVRLFVEVCKGAILSCLPLASID